MSGGSVLSGAALGSRGAVLGDFGVGMAAALGGRPAPRSKRQTVARLIAQLFGNGEAGALYNPRDLSTLSQTSTGVLGNVGVGDPVGKMLDLSGNGNHAIQATAANRPILRQDANGKYYLEFDGVNDSLVVTMALTQPFERFAAIQQISWTANDLVFDGGTGANLYQWSASPRLNSWNNGSELSLDTAPVGQTVATYERFDGANSRFATSTDFWKVVNNGPNNLSRWAIGGSGAACSNIRFYGGLMRAGRLSYDQIIQIQNWLSDLAGISQWTGSEVNELLIVAGQSNALSRGTSGQAVPAALAAIDSTRVQIWNGTTFVGYVAGTNSEPTGADPTCWGPEAEYAVRWLAANPTGTLYIVKRPVGATDIGTWIPGGGNWNALLQWFLAAKVALIATPHRTNCIWCQGESDAASSSGAAAYQGNELTFFDAMRYRMGARHIGVMRIYNNSPTLTYAATVRAAQNAACLAVNYAFLVNTDDGSVIDGLHYDVATVTTMGSRMFDAIATQTGIQA